MPEKTWQTLITITCSNPELDPWWRAIENDLRLCVAGVGWNEDAVKRCLNDMHKMLKAIADTTMLGGNTFSRRRRRVR